MLELIMEVTQFGYWSYKVGAQGCHIYDSSQQEKFTQINSVRTGSRYDSDIIFNSSESEREVGLCCFKEAIFETFEILWVQEDEEDSMGPRCNIGEYKGDKNSELEAELYIV